jgi:hypothetical protein
LFVLALACNGRATAPAPSEAPVPAVVRDDAPAAPAPPARKAPAKTTKPHTADQLATLATLDVAGYTRTVRKLDAGFLDVVLAGTDLTVTVTIQPCLRCTPLAIDRWRSEKEALMVTLAPELRDRPDTTFEFGEAATSIYVFQLGHADGELGTAFTNAYILYHHDGVNQIRAIAAASEPKPSKEELARAVPRDRLEAAATTVFDAYVAAWGN